MTSSHPLTRPRNWAIAGLATLALLASACASEPADTAGDSVADWQAAGAAVLAKANCNGHALTCPGAAMPTAKLTDDNPTSATHKKALTLAEVGEGPKVVALLAAW
ncbi:MAG: hypothetical protein KC502_13435 [Myxococcales bacterium]|nr:hypothetical protein [Myxococcales bacterium]